MTNITPRGVFRVEESSGVIHCLSTTHDGGDSTWCVHIRDLIKSGEDAAGVTAGHAIRVPVFPTMGVWVEVEVGDFLIPEIAAPMRMHYTPDFGSNLVVDLGLWTKGDGRWAMRSVILDYIRSKVDPNEMLGSAPIITRCPASMHGFSQELKLKAPVSPDWKWACLWSIVMEKACLPCIEQSSDPDSDDDNNGLSGLQNNNPPWQASRGTT